MLTQIDFDGELALVDKDEGRDDQQPSERAEEAYLGPERRRGERRSGRDRRELVRFEAKADRRSGKDRRRGTWDIKDRI